MAEPAPSLGPTHSSSASPSALASPRAPHRAQNTYPQRHAVKPLLCYSTRNISKTRKRSHKTHDAHDLEPQRLQRTKSQGLRSLVRAAALLLLSLHPRAGGLPPAVRAAKKSLITPNGASFHLERGRRVRAKYSSLPRLPVLHSPAALGRNGSRDLLQPLCKEHTLSP